MPARSCRWRSRAGSTRTPAAARGGAASGTISDFSSTPLAARTSRSAARATMPLCEGNGASRPARRGPPRRRRARVPRWSAVTRSRRCAAGRPTRRRAGGRAGRRAASRRRQGVQPGQRLQRRASQHRDERRAARSTPAPRPAAISSPSPVAHLRQRRRRALEHGTGVRAAQQRLGRRLRGRYAAARGRAARRRCRRALRRRPRARPPATPTRPGGPRSPAEHYRATTVGPMPPDDLPTRRRRPRRPPLCFGGVADAYERGRPGYPIEAVPWLTGDEPLSVLELGAGTGKLTEQLVALGHDVHATDPDPAMLDIALPQLRRRPGSRRPRPRRSRSADATFDVVVAAQAYHWFDHERALPEIARVLKRGGCFALVWNTRDERIPWVKRLGRLIGSQEQRRRPRRGARRRRRTSVRSREDLQALAGRRPVVDPGPGPVALQRRRPCRAEAREAQAARGAGVLRRLRPRHGRHAAALRHRVLPRRRRHQAAVRQAPRRAGRLRRRGRPSRSGSPTARRRSPRSSTRRPTTTPASC